MKHNLLNHLAIIMDGNGRWASKRGLPKLEGHRIGAETARKIVDAAIQQGIKHLSLYAFSSENWHRPFEEVNSLMYLLEYYISNEVESLNSNGIKLIFIGDLSKLSERLQQKLYEVMELTKVNTILNLYIAVSYGGRQELVEAFKKITQLNITTEQISQELIYKNLYSAEMPDVDLLIRSSGEQRISNFLLWHIAYSELYFTKKYWPDFDEDDLNIAIEEFKKRTRNFGQSRDTELDAE